MDRLFRFSYRFYKRLSSFVVILIISTNLLGLSILDSSSLVLSFNFYKVFLLGLRFFS